MHYPKITTFVRRVKRKEMYVHITKLSSKTTKVVPPQWAKQEDRYSRRDSCKKPLEAHAMTAEGPGEAHVDVPLP